MYKLAIIQKYNPDYHGVAPDAIIGKNLVIYLKHSNETFSHFLKSYNFIRKRNRHNKLAIVYTYKYMDYVLAIDKTKYVINKFINYLKNYRIYKNPINLRNRQIYGKFISRKL
jgi:hypothetical protein